MSDSIIRMETKEIQEKIGKMVTLVIKQHHDIIKALVNNNKEKALLVINDDRLVNAKFDEITADLEFLITKTPLDKDLRRTMAYIMIAQDLERIGDYVKYIGHFITQSTTLETSSMEKILQIHRLFMRMLKKITTVINEEQYNQVIDLVKRERKINNLSDQLIKDLISSIINSKDKIKIAARVFAINIIVEIEHSAGHITHICELVDYIYTGKHVDLQ